MKVHKKRGATMPYLTEYDESSKLLIRVWWGVVTGEEILDAHDQLLQHLKNGLQIHYVIADYSDVSSLDMSSDLVRLLADKDHLISQHESSICAAIIATNTSVYGMIRMWQTYAEKTGWMINVFNNRTDAEIWLNEQRNELKPHQAGKP